MATPCSGSLRRLSIPGAASILDTSKTSPLLQEQHHLVSQPRLAVVASAPGACNTATWAVCESSQKLVRLNNPASPSCHVVAQSVSCSGDFVVLRLRFTGTPSFQARLVIPD